MLTAAYKVVKLFVFRRQRAPGPGGTGLIPARGLLQVPGQPGLIVMSRPGKVPSCQKTGIQVSGWYASVVSACGKQRQEGQEFKPWLHSKSKASLGYIGKPCLNKIKQKLTLEIPTPRGLRKEEHKFKACLGNLLSPCSG